MDVVSPTSAGDGKRIKNPKPGRICLWDSKNQFIPLPNERSLPRVLKSNHQAKFATSSRSPNNRNPRHPMAITKNKAGRSRTSGCWLETDPQSPASRQYNRHHHHSDDIDSHRRQRISAGGTQRGTFHHPSYKHAIPANTSMLVLWHFSQPLIFSTSQ